ncbi:MAG: PKD domain-containing protein [Planctomycetes bacterium]|nr:PKD domain-containing protein [Planctomycetota bacterium]
MRRSLALPVVMAFLGGFVPGLLQAQTTTVSGTITYTDRIYTTTGFTGATAQRPVRYAKVEIINNATSLPTGATASTTTDASGAYSMAGVIDGGNVFVRVYTEEGLIPAANPVGINAVVQTMSGSTYTAASSVTATAGGALTINVDITTLSVAGAFNIWDCACFAFEWVRTWTLANGDAYPSPATLLTLKWETGNTNGTFYNKTTDTLNLLGKSTDTDEYDDDIILHEVGHYVADSFARDDSPGGSHIITQHLDIRLAYSEGWAHFFSASVREWVQNATGLGTDPAGIAGGNNRYPNFTFQIDTFGSGNSSFEIETPSFDTQTTSGDNEVAVAAALWDLVDTTNTDTGGFDAIPGAAPASYDLAWKVQDNDIEANVPPPTDRSATLERFFDGWMTRNAGIATQTRNIFRARSVRYENNATTGGGAVPTASSDADDAGAGNNAIGTATDLTALAFPITRSTLTYFPAADEDWFLFAAASGTSYQIETLNQADGCDTTLEIRDAAGTAVQASNDDRSSSDNSSIIQWSAPSTGNFSVRSVRYAQTDAPGRYGSYDLKISVTGTGTNVAPTVSLSASPASGVTPLAVTFSASASDSDGSIVTYEWDFNGNGLYDLATTGSGPVTHTFTGAGAFTPAVRVTDDDGLSTVATTGVTVTAATEAPTVTATAAFTPGAVPLVVTFTATAAAATGSSIVSYEWDFDGSGTADFVSSSASTTFTYRLAGAYLPVVRVTDNTGLSASAFTNSVTAGSAAVPPVATIAPNASSGTVPLSVTFTATGGASYQWDFEGDSRRDQSTTAATTTFRYTVPGTYTATVFARDGAGVEDDATTTITVLGTTSVTAWLDAPSEGQSVSGRQIGLLATVLPSGTSKTVQFQFQVSGSGTWNNIGASQSGSGTAFTTSWDASSLGGSTVELRALVNSTLSTGDTSNTVTVLASGTADVQVTTVSSDVITEAAVTDTTNVTLVLGDGTRVFVPFGAFAGPVRLSIRQLSNLPAAANGVVAALFDARLGHDVTVASGSGTLQKSVTLTFAYTDTTPSDGLLDSTGIAESSLVVAWYDTGAAIWRKDRPTDIDTSGNTASLTTPHFTTFAAFGTGGSSAGASSGGSSGGDLCFASGVGSAAPGWKSILALLAALVTLMIARRGL